MSPGTTSGGRRAFAALAVLVLVALALFAGLLGRLRPDTEALFSEKRLRVTSSRDGGAGSLREALFAAGRSEGRPTIVCEVERVELETPLPPLVSARGVVVTAPENSICEIDARAAGAEPVLNVAAPASVLSRVRVRGATSAAVLVRAEGVRLEDVEILDSTQGVIAVDGAKGLLIERALFARNGVGVRVEPSSGVVRVRESRFLDHDEAGVWAVAPDSVETSRAPRLVVRESLFERNRIGVVTIHTPATIEDNEFNSSRHAAVYLTGRHAVVRGNRVRNGAAYGLFADAADGALIEDNELDRNGAVGALVRYGGSSVLRANRVYSNPYGIVVVLGEPARPDRLVDNFIFDHSLDGLFVLGSSPILRENQIRGNRAAGIRVLDFLSASAGLVSSRPLMENNVVQGNGLETVRGEFRLEEEERDVDSEAAR